MPLLPVCSHLYLPPGAIFADSNCPDLLNTPPGTTLDQCEAKCASTTRCTAFNLGPGGCALRACKLHTEPDAALQGFVGWASYPLRCPAPPPPPPPPPPLMPLFKVGASITAKHGAACLDGSPPYYHYRPATNASSTRWVLFVNGGAWCFTAVNPPLGGDSCVQRARTPGGSSVAARPQADMGGIIGASPERNPDFFQDHHVHIAYCDGASLSSGRAEPVAVPPNQWHNGSLYFRGRANLNAVVEELLVTHRMADADEVIFTGGKLLLEQHRESCDSKLLLGDLGSHSSSCFQATHSHQSDELDLAAGGRQARPAARLSSCNWITSLRSCHHACVPWVSLTRASCSTPRTYLALGSTENGTGSRQICCGMPLSTLTQRALRSTGLWARAGNV